MSNSERPRPELHVHIDERTVRRYGDGSFLAVAAAKAAALLSRLRWNGSVFEVVASPEHTVIGLDDAIIHAARQYVHVLDGFQNQAKKAQAAVDDLHAICAVVCKFEPDKLGGTSHADRIRELADAYSAKLVKAERDNLALGTRLKTCAEAMRQLALVEHAEKGEYFEPVVTSWECRLCGETMDYEHEISRHKPDCPIFIVNQATP